MNQQPDKIFRDKLHGYQKPVSANAWTKLESKLDQKRGIPIWMKIAASLLVVLSVLGLLLGDRFSNSQVAEVKKPLQQKSSESIQAEIKESPGENIRNEKMEIVTGSDIEKPSAHPWKQKREPEKIVEPEILPLDESIVAEIEVQREDQSTGLAIRPAEIPTSSGIVLVYSANEVNEKYLIKKDTTQATTEDKKPSTLQKLWSKARELKHNQDPFGELRQKKNEILALDFKKEEQRNQNR